MQRKAVLRKDAYLKSGEMLGPFFGIHPPQPDANGTGRDDDDSMPIFTKLNRSLNDQTQYG